MRMTAAFIAYELRTQLRSLRFRSFAAAYVGLCSLPAILIYVQRGQFQQTIGAAAFAYETLTVAPLLTGVFAALLALDGITREQGGGAWTTVTLTGLTNTGYVLRRWLALEILILPLTALPIVAAAGLALATGYEIPTPAVFWGPWLLRILPLAFLGSTLGLALGTLGGGGMSTFVVAGAAIFLVPELANAGLALFGYRLTARTGLSLDSANYMVQRMLMALDSDEGRMLFPHPACEAGFDLASAAEQSLGDGTLLAALATAALGLSVVWLRRTQPDIRPRTIRPDHPLRSFLAVLGRLRERFVPDPAPAPADRLTVALALLLAAVPAGVGLARAHHYDGLAWQRQEAEVSGRPAPTSRDVMPGRWRVAGRLGPGLRGDVARRGRAAQRGQGAPPPRRLPAQPGAGPGGGDGGPGENTAAPRLGPPGGRSGAADRAGGAARAAVPPHGTPGRGDPPAAARVLDGPARGNDPPHRSSSTGRVRPRPDGLLAQLPGAVDFGLPGGPGRRATCRRSCVTAPGR